MLVRKFLKGLSAVSAAATIGMLIGYPSGQAFSDNNGAQDEKQMIQTGYTVAASTGIHLTITNQDPDLVGLGSYIVNVTSDCNLCHSPVFIGTSFTEPSGNPYLLPGVFSGQKKVDPRYYLGGNQDFGPAAAGSPDIVSRNLTPDKTGKPEGHTLSEFMQIMKTGVDLDYAHPNCSATITTECIPLSSGVNGAVLQVMPWPAFQGMTDRQLTAIYIYLSTIPCLEGGPGEPTSGRCS
jgi:hypothetical protein